MPGKHFFEYAIIRLVPKVEREEFMNVGVILFCKNAGYLKCKFHLDMEKVAVFCKEILEEDIQNNLNAFQKFCAGSSDGGPVAQWEKADRFRWLTAQRSASIQTSRPHNGFSDNLDETLEKIYREQVL